MKNENILKILADDYKTLFKKKILRTYVYCVMIKGKYYKSDILKVFIYKKCLNFVKYE